LTVDQRMGDFACYPEHIMDIVNIVILPVYSTCYQISSEAAAFTFVL